MLLSCRNKDLFLATLPLEEMGMPTCRETPRKTNRLTLLRERLNQTAAETLGHATATETEDLGGSPDTMLYCEDAALTRFSHGNPAKQPAVSRNAANEKNPDTMLTNVIPLPKAGGVVPTLPTPTIMIEGVTLRFYLRESGNWEVHYPQPGTDKRQRKNTKTSDLTHAKRRAEEMYRDAIHRFKRGLAPNMPTFAKVVAAFMSDLDHLATINPKTGPAAIKTQHRIKTVLLPVFGALPFNEIDEPAISGFEKGRLEQWAADRAKPLAGGQSRGFIKSPSAYTQNRDRALLQQISSWAVRRKLFTPNDAPQFEITPRTEEQRGCFEDWQFSKLDQHLKAYCLAARNERNRVARLKFRYYVLIHAFTGMRPGTESRNLRFCDFKAVGDGMIITIVDGKTGSRPVSAPPEVKQIVDAMRVLHGSDPAPETKLWDCQSYTHEFKRHLRLLGMTEDARGLTLALYSLRHLYITRGLYAGRTVHELADQCGTSLQQIESHYRHVLRSLRGMNLMVSHLPAIAV